MKTDPMNMTIQSSDTANLMIDIIQSSPEELSGVLNNALKKLMMDTGADHVMISVLSHEVAQTRTHFIPFDQKAIQSIIRDKSLPMIFQVDDVDFPVSDIMHQRFSETWVIIPLQKGYLSFEFTSKLSNTAILIDTSSWLVKSLEFKINAIETIQELDQTRKTKSDFLSNMSHEIRTPLSGIYNAFYLLNTTGLTHEQIEYVNHGMISVNQLSSMIDDMLDYANIESGGMSLHPVLFDLEHEMIRLYQHYKPLAEEKKLSFFFDYDLQLNNQYVGDIARIRQVMNHLLDNAIKYTNQGSIELNIHFKAIQDQHTWIELNVADSGIGIPSEALNQIKDAFIQVDNSKTKDHQGTGLGLSIASELTQLLGGKLEAHSIVKEGSRFTVSIPLVTQQPLSYPHVNHMKALVVSQTSQPSRFVNLLVSMGIECLYLDFLSNQLVNFIIIEDHKLDSSSISQLKTTYGLPTVLTISSSLDHQFQKGIDIIFEWPTSRAMIEYKIHQRLSHHQKDHLAYRYGQELKGYALLVDDNRLNRVALQSILLKQGIRSTTVESGLKAIELVKNEVFDIIFMDIQMPVMDGLEATRRIRNLGQAYEQIPIIAITANQYFKDYDLMKSTQINDVLFKPIRMEHLGQILRKYIPRDRGHLIPEELPVFDLIEFNERFDGSDDIAIEVMQTFLEEYQHDVLNIKNAILASDIKRIYETTHYFKGSCAYLSGKRAVWLLNQMTTFVKQGQLDLMSMYQNLLETEIDALAKLVKSKLA